MYEIIECDLRNTKEDHTFDSVIKLWKTCIAGVKLYFSGLFNKL